MNIQYKVGLINNKYFIMGFEALNGEVSCTWFGLR